MTTVHTRDGSKWLVEDEFNDVFSWVKGIAVSESSKWVELTLASGEPIVLRKDAIFAIEKLKSLSISKDELTP
jgi:hypothetical protein